MTKKFTIDRTARYILAGVLSAIFSSLAWIPEQEAVYKLTPLLVGSLAPLFAGIIIYLLFPKVRLINFSTIIENIKPFVLVLFIRNTVGFLLFATALLHTSSLKIMFLTKMEPYIVLFIHWLFYKERVKQQDLILLVVHIIGALLLSLGMELEFSIEQWGDVLVFCGLLASASVYKPGQLLAQKLGSLRSTMLTNFCSGLMLLPIALFFDSEAIFNNSEALSGFGYLLVTVILYYICSTSFWFYSLSGTPAWLNSALRALGPVVAAPLAWLCFNKSLDKAQLFGAAIVIATSILLVINSKKSGHQQG